MKRLLVGLCTLLMLFVFSIPALAVDVNLNINGKDFQPITIPQLQEGTTMVPLYLIERISGADISVSEESITIYKGTDTLVLTLNDTQASLNGDLINLPQAPAEVSNEIIVPIRAVMESFGATIDWVQETKTVLVDFQEKRAQMSPEDLLLKSNEASLAFNTYKARGDLQQTMQMINPETGEPESIDIQMVMDMAMQNEPILLHVKSDMTASSLQLPEEENMATEVLINEEGMYTTMPDQGWVKLEIPGMDIKALLEESSQDPLSSLEQLTEAGVLLSFSNDQEIDGHSYWVLNVTVGLDGFQQILDEVMQNIPLPEEIDENATDQLSQVFQELFSNMQADIYYRIWVDQDTYFPKYMDLYTTMDIKTEIPAPSSEEDPVLLDISLQQSGTFEYYDLDEPISVPDVSDAKSLEDIYESESSIDPKTEQAPVAAEDE